MVARCKFVRRGGREGKTGERMLRLSSFSFPRSLVPSLVTSHSRFELSFLCDQSAKIWVYGQLSLRRTPLGQALSVGLRVMSVL